jgi:hypothetical protein
MPTNDTYRRRTDLVVMAARLLTAGLAPSTRHNYDKTWTRFVEFSVDNGLDPSFPVPEDNLCLFAAYLSRTNAYKSVKGALAAVRSRHTDMGIRLDTSVMVRLMRVCDGIRREKGERTTRPRLPMTVDILNRMQKMMDWKQEEDVLLFAISTVATYGLFRLGELVGVSEGGDSGILWRHVSRQHDAWVFTLEQSKTDPFRHGAVVKVFKNSSVSCPFTAFDRYHALSSHKSDDWPVFTLKDGSKVDRAWVTNRLRSRLAAMGMNANDYSGHSFRKGGASSLAERGVPDSTIKQMGRWKSVAYQRYVTVSEEKIREAFEVTPSGLGLGNPLQGFGGNVPLPHPPRTTTLSPPTLFATMNRKTTSKM